MSNVQVFQNQEMNVNVRAISNEDGSISMQKIQQLDLGGLNERTELFTQDGELSIVI